MFLLVFVIIQIVLLVMMLSHDWVRLPPLNDVDAVKMHTSRKELIIGTIINTIIVLIPLMLTVLYIPAISGLYPFWVALTITLVYSVLTVGTVAAWWVPYVWGSSLAHKQGFIEYKDTHHFLPARGDNIIPNTLHVILHIFVWSCFLCSLYIVLFMSC